MLTSIQKALEISKCDDVVDTATVGYSTIYVYRHPYISSIIATDDGAFAVRCPKLSESDFIDTVRKLPEIIKNSVYMRATKRLFVTSNVDAVNSYIRSGVIKTVKPKEATTLQIPSNFLGRATCARKVIRYLNKFGLTCEGHLHKKTDKEYVYIINVSGCDVISRVRVEKSGYQISFIENSDTELFKMCNINASEKTKGSCKYYKSINTLNVKNYRSLMELLGNFYKYKQEMLSD